MPSRLRAPKDSVKPINQDWVKAQLAALGTVCEWEGCKGQAVYAFEGFRAVAYLCDFHTLLVDEQPGLVRVIDDHLWSTFRSMYDFIYQNHMSGGQLLRSIDEREEQIKRNEKAAEQAQRAVIKQLQKEVKQALKQTDMIGLPDDELAEGRGVQSPSLPDLQLVFRATEPEAPDAVALPQPKESEPIIFARLF